MNIYTNSNYPDLIRINIKYKYNPDKYEHFLTLIGIKYKNTQITIKPIKYKHKCFYTTVSSRCSVPLSYRTTSSSLSDDDLLQCTCSSVTPRFTIWKWTGGASSVTGLRSYRTTSPSLSDEDMLQCTCSSVTPRFTIWNWTGGASGVTGLRQRPRRQRQSTHVAIANTNVTDGVTPITILFCSLSNGLAIVVLRSGNGVVRTMKVGCFEAVVDDRVGDFGVEVGVKVVDLEVDVLCGFGVEVSGNVGGFWVEVVVKVGGFGVDVKVDDLELYGLEVDVLAGFGVEVSGNMGGLGVEAGVKVGGLGVDASHRVGGFEQDCCRVVFIPQSDNTLTKLTFNVAQLSVGFPRRSTFISLGILFFNPATSMLDKLLNLRSSTITQSKAVASSELKLDKPSLLQSSKPNKTTDRQALPNTGITKHSNKKPNISRERTQSKESESVYKYGDRETSGSENDTGTNNGFKPWENF